MLSDSVSGGVCFLGMDVKKGEYCEGNIVTNASKEYEKITYYLGTDG